MLFLVLQIAGPVMIHACPARTLQIAIIDCIFWFHSRASNFQTSVGKERCTATMQYCFFLQVVPSIHVAVIAASSCHSLTSTTAAALSSEVICHSHGAAAGRPSALQVGPTWFLRHLSSEHCTCNLVFTLAQDTL